MLKPPVSARSGSGRQEYQSDGAPHMCAQAVVIMYPVDGPIMVLVQHRSLAVEQATSSSTISAEAFTPDALALLSTTGLHRNHLDSRQAIEMTWSMACFSLFYLALRSRLDCGESEFEYHRNYLQQKMNKSIGFRVLRATNFYYHNDSADHRFTFIFGWFSPL